MRYKKLTIALAMCFSFMATAQTDEIVKNFSDPPMEYRPRVWWHWLNGNITIDGIRKDLMWMKEAGVGGVQHFDIGLDVPTIVPERLPFMSNGWKEAFNYAVNLADSLGMEFAIACSSGWSDTGGPWVTPDDAMKTLNWKEMTVEGGRKIVSELPEPNMISGKYPGHSFFTRHHPEYDYYRDIAVIAVKIPAYDLSMEEMGVRLSNSGGTESSRLNDGDLNTVCQVAPGPDGHAWIQFSFDEPKTIRSFFYGHKDDYVIRSGRHWEVSDDGQTFKTIEMTIPECPTPFMTIDIPETQGRYFRFVNDNEGKNMDYTELRIFPVTKVNLDTDKAGFFTYRGLRDFHYTPAFKDATALEDVIDLTDCCKDGKLIWNAPEGRWRIYRFGYTLRGRMNNPASPEARGLETDKLSRGATERYYRTYLKMMNDACGGSIGTKLTHLMIDSYEAGCQTWTKDMQEEFSARRGYDLTKWLPALAGHIIGSSEMTEHFLQDWRQTLGEMMVDYHYNALDPILKEYGLKRYTEFHESGRAFPTDGMEIKRHADIPMSAFWVNPDSLASFQHLADIRESASIAHIYGQNTVAAESFTTDGSIIDNEGQLQSWNVFPAKLKPAADMAMAAGLNCFVFHCSPHQPDDIHVPGLSLGKFGMWFQRHETWAHEAKCWTDYLARSSYLLRQGSFVSDIAYFISETTNITDRFCNEAVPVPEGYAFDFVNRQAMEMPSFHYKALIIDKEVECMSIEALRALHGLVERGIIVAGREPASCLGLTGRSEEFIDLVSSIWNPGRPNVIPFGALEEALIDSGIKPDVSFEGRPHPYVHRHLEDGELYWIVNDSSSQAKVTASFRSGGQVATVLHADTGTAERWPCRTVDGRTVIELDMLPHDAQFIVLSDGTPDKVGVTASKSDVTAGSPSKKVKATKLLKTIDLSTAWDLSFKCAENYCEAPSPLHLDSLVSLSKLEPTKYFSGTATYRKGFKMNEKGSKVILDLGKVRSIARIRVNGKDCSVAWKAPFQADITDALSGKLNLLEIEVTNSWACALIGGLQLPNAQLYTPDSVLPESGLIGPVKILVFK